MAKNGKERIRCELLLRAMGETPVIGVATVCFMNRRLILLHTRLVVSVTVRWATQQDRGISLQIDVFQVHAADDWLTNASRHAEREECENKKYPDDSFCHVLLTKFAAAQGAALSHSRRHVRGDLCRHHWDDHTVPNWHAKD
jgi:hypothetical protein